MEFELIQGHIHMHKYASIAFRFPLTVLIIGCKELTFKVEILTDTCALLSRPASAFHPKYNANPSV